MNKTLKFELNLIAPILNGKKTSTWRIDDDKNLAEGDMLDFLNSENKQPFATAIVEKIIEKPFKNLTHEDRIGHEKYDSDKHMYQWFSEHYKKPVTGDTLVKIIHFKII